MKTRTQIRPGLWIVPLLMSISSTSCQKDELSTVPTGRDVRFTVTESASWNTTPTVKSRATEDSTEAPVVTDVLALQGENPSDSLFLHVMVSDGIESGRLGGEEPQTRAAPVTDMETYGSFGVTSYVYEGAWNESLTPTHMYNVEVRKEQGNVWAPVTTYNWPGIGKKIKFYAYAPYNSPGLTLPDQTTPGTPVLGYVTPAAVSEQKDLLVAVSDEFDGDRINPAELTFKHALTAVKFVAGDDLWAGKIEKITLKGIYGTASYDMRAASWSDLDDTKDFSQTLSVTLDGTPDAEITAPEATFMVIPQTVPADASIEIVFVDALTSTTRTLTAQIGAQQWPIGKTVTYRVSTTSFVVTPFFMLLQTPLDNTYNYTYKGGSSNFTVASFSSVRSPDGANGQYPEPYTTEFSLDGGQTWTSSRPEWLSLTSSGSSGAYAIAATVAPSIGLERNADDFLQNAPEVIGANGFYDLSTNDGTSPMRTANCYVINAPGKYSLPLVYGNAIDFVKNPTDGYNTLSYTDRFSGDALLTSHVNHLDAAITDPYIYNNANCVPDNAFLIWQDEQGLVTNVNLTSDGKHLTFEVPAGSIAQGNAIVAVRDANDVIMWSWHIWVTDYVLGTNDIVVTPNYLDDSKYTLMNVNVGYCGGHHTDYAARSILVRFTQTKTGNNAVVTFKQASHRILYTSSSSMIYQGGRKDPMLPIEWKYPDPDHPDIIDFSSNKACYADNADYAWKFMDIDASLGTAVQNPHIMYGGFDPSLYGLQYIKNLWNRYMGSDLTQLVKTVYDPCPVGYCLPVHFAFEGFVYGNRVSADENYNMDWTLINSPQRSYPEVLTLLGFEFYCNAMPMQGEYDVSGGTIYLSKETMRMPSAHPITGQTGLYEGSGYWFGDDVRDYGFRYFSYGLTAIWQNHFEPGQALAIRPMKEQ